MKRLFSLLAGLVVLVACPLPSIAVQVSTVTDFFEEHPGVRVYGSPFNQRSGILDESRSFGAIYGTVVATGATAEESAWNHVNQIRPLLGTDWGTLVPNIRENGELLLPVMAGSATAPRFYTFRFNQQFGGLPVFRSGIGFLVRNEPNNPLVASGIDIKDLAGFAVPADGKAQVTKKMRNNVSALINSQNPAGHAEAGLKSVLQKPARRQLFSPPLVVTDEELVIFAGVNRQPANPELAVKFIATQGSVHTWPNYHKYLIVASVETGNILLSETGIHNTDVTGSVRGRATSGLGSLECHPEVEVALPYAEVAVVGGASVFADVNGNFTIPHGGTSPVTAQSWLRGLRFEVFDFSGVIVTPEMTLNITPPGPANFLYNPSDTEFETANVNAYVEANLVRDYVLSYEPAFPFINIQQSFNIRTNIDDFCNAYYDGSSVNFFRAGGGCYNTAFSDIIYHEYGHHMIETSENGQGEMGEGSGDVMGLLIQDEPVLAYGFFGDCSGGLRDAVNSLQFPCGDEIHTCGQVLSGAVWQTRNQLAITEPSSYRDIGASLFLGMLITRGQMVPYDPVIDPFITILYLELDDDDGNINNGTPHYTEIANGFGAHSLDAPPLTLVDFGFPGGRPELISSNGGVMFNVAIQAVSQSPLSGTGTMYVDRGNGFETLPMNEVSPNLYQANFPPSPCGQVINYYFSVDATGGNTQFEPAGAPGLTFQGISGSALRVGFVDNFETDTGWFDIGDAFDGIWERGVPAGGGNRGDPLTDGDGSGQCFLTGNFFGNSDVDDGYTQLVSPLMNAIENPGEIALLTYRRWYSNNTGLDPENDVFVVEISNERGQNLVVMETVGPSGAEVGGGWVEKTFRISDFVIPTDEMRLTFTASDYGDGSIVEAGVDAVSIRFVSCEPLAPLVAQASKLLDGLNMGGTLAQTGAADDQYLELDPSPTANPVKQKIDMLMLSISPTATPASIQFRLEAAMLGGPVGDVIQSIQLLNYQTGQFETIDVRPAENSDTAISINPTGDPARFVKAGTRELTARVNWHSSSFAGTPFYWSVDIDEAVWFIQ